LREYHLYYYEFRSGRIISIVSETSLLGPGWIDVSRDESWIACARETFPESELILVENFFP